MPSPLICELEPPVNDSLIEIFEDLRGAHDAPFITYEHLPQTTTWREFDDAVRRLATALKDLGVNPGHRVAAVLDNGPALVEGWFATMALGAVWVPINTALRGTFLTHVLKDCQAEILFAEADLIPRVNDVIADLPNIKKIIKVAAPEAAKREENISGKGVETILFDALRSAAPLKTIYKPKPSDLAAFIYTSGTTGPSKGCMLPHAYITNLSRVGLMGRGRGEPAYTTMPLFHLNAMCSVTATLIIGCRLTVGKRFSVSNFWSSIEASGAKFTNLLGPMAAMLANAPDDDAMLRCKGQLRRVLSSPFPPDVREVFRERFGVAEVNAVGGYGMTEGAPFTNTPEGVDSRPNASGTRTSWFDVEIVDDDDNVLPNGEIGEVVCRPNYPNIMFTGYWGRPEATVQAFRNLWFHTGDLGRFDEDGFFYFEDRKKDYLRRRGENISSMEVENTFHQHKDVAEVACYGVPSELGEDDVQISVVLREKSTLTEEQLCEWSIDKLPYFAVPRYIEFLDAIPKSVVGRPRKVELRNRDAGYPRWDREKSNVTLSRR